MTIGFAGLFPNRNSVQFMLAKLHVSLNISELTKSGCHIMFELDALNTCFE